MRISPTPPAWRPEENPRRPIAETAKVALPSLEQSRVDSRISAEQLEIDLAALNKPLPSGVAGRYQKQTRSSETMTLTTLVAKIRQLETTNKTGADEALRKLQSTSPELYDLVIGML